MNIKFSIPVLLFIVSLLFTFLHGACSCNEPEPFIEKKVNGMVYSDSSKIDSVVYREGKGFLALDWKGNTLFEIFPFDNGPDYTSDGLFRIIENGKIGYADEMGNIVIKPQFDAALPFHEGMAAFCEHCKEFPEGEHRIWKGGKWGFTDRTGQILIPAKYDRVIDPFDKGIAKVVYSGSEMLINKKGVRVETGDMNFNEWIELLGKAAKIAVKLFFSESLKIESSWQENEKFIFGADDHLEYLRIKVTAGDREGLIEYDIIPWQSFTVRSGSGFLFPTEEVITVTDYAVIYAAYDPREKNKNDLETIEKFHKVFAGLLEININQQLQDETPVMPENVQFITKNLYLRYTDLQVALPGSLLPDDSAWTKTFRGKMIYLQLVPDIGEIKQRWIRGDDLLSDTYYTSAEEDLLRIFSEALDDAITSPGRRKEIFNTAKSKIRKLFSAANSYVNFLYDKYEARLGSWLFVDIAMPGDHMEELLFGDYHPKLTKDTALDFMPSLWDDIGKLPEAVLENYLILLELLNSYQENAKTNPGQWEDGNMVLGALPLEYSPSKEELMASETGDRLAKIISTYPGEEILEFLENQGETPTDIEYIRYTFVHADVMGSGRFFYVQGSEKVTLSLKEQ